MALILVVAAALIRERQVLLAERPAGKPMAGLWEFPGGKLSPEDATPEAALIRELREELGIALAAEALEPLGFASHPLPHGHLLMPLWAARIWEGEPQGLEGQRLAWVDAGALADYPMPPADLPLLPLVRAALL